MNKPLYRYKVFGLNVESELKMDNLIESDGAIDVTVNFASSKEMENKKKDYMQFSIPNVAVYYLKNSDEVLIEPLENTTEEAIVLYLEGLIFAIILMQKGMIPLHGSAINLAGNCIIILGDSGAGKSSLAAGLIKIGGKIITDDVIATKKINEKYYVLPSFPEQKLCGMSLEANDMDSAKHKKIQYEYTSLEKYFVSRKDDFYQKASEMSNIFLLSPTDESILKTSEIKGLVKLQMLLKYVYNKRFIDMLGLNEEEFVTCSNISRQCNIHVIKRPIGQFTVDSQIEYIKSVI